MKKVEPGEAEDWSDEEIEKLAQIDESDVAEAQRWFKRNAPDEFEGLLEAELEP